MRKYAEKIFRRIFQKGIEILKIVLYNSHGNREKRSVVENDYKIC